MGFLREDNPEQQQHFEALVELLNKHGDKVRALHASPYKVAVACTGVGAMLNHVLWHLGGASSTIIGSSFPYMREATDRLVGFPLLEAGYMSITAAHALSAAAYYGAQTDIFTAQQIDDVRYLIGVGMTGAVATNRRRRGEDVARISLRLLDGSVIKVYEIELFLQKETLGRNGQDLLCNIVLLNGILTLARLETIPLYEVFGSTSPQFVYDEVDPDRGHEIVPDEVVLRVSERRTRESDAQQSLEMVRDAAQHPGGLTFDCSGNLLSVGQHHGPLCVVPASIAPLTPAHVAMVRKAAIQTGLVPILDVTRNNADPNKPAFSFEQLVDRAKQLIGIAPVMLSEANGRFLDKARTIRTSEPGQPYQQLTFVIGVDTAARILMPKYYEDVSAGVETVLREFIALNVNFLVVGRGEETALGFCRKLTSALARALFSPLHIDGIERLGVSSTAMRI